MLAYGGYVHVLVSRAFLKVSMIVVMTSMSSWLLINVVLLAMGVHALERGSGSSGGMVPHFRITLRIGSMSVV